MSFKFHHLYGQKTKLFSVIQLRLESAFCKPTIVHQIAVSNTLPRSDSHEQNPNYRGRSEKREW